MCCGLFHSATLLLFCSIDSPLSLSCHTLSLSCHIIIFAQCNYKLVGDIAFTLVHISHFVFVGSDLTDGMKSYCADMTYRTWEGVIIHWHGDNADGICSCEDKTAPKWGVVEWECS